MLVLTRSDIASVLEMDKVIEAVAEAHADLATGHGSELGPASVAIAFSSALWIPMVAAGANGLGGVKLLTDTPDNAAKGLPVQRSTLVLVDTVTGACEAFLDGAAITRCRTAAVSAVATRCLSREDAAVLGFIGAGALARSHLQALCLVRSIQRVLVWSRHRDTALAFADHAVNTGIEVEVADSPESVVRRSDILCTLTPSPSPLVLGTWLHPGIHINAVGSPPRKDYREIDSEAIRLSHVVVDSYHVASHESGNVLIPLAEGAISENHFRDELGEVIIHEKPGRTSLDQITLYNSVGLCSQDIAAARLVLAAARERGLGTDIELSV